MGVSARGLARGFDSTLLSGRREVPRTCGTIEGESGYGVHVSNTSDAERRRCSENCNPSATGPEHQESCSYVAHALSPHDIHVLLERADLNRH